MVRDGESEDDEGLAIVEGDVEGFHREVAAAGGLCDGESFPAAEIVFDFRGFPFPRGGYGWAPTGFIDGEPGVGKGSDSGGEVGGGIGAGLEMVAQADGAVFDGYAAVFLCDLNRGGGG